MPTCVMLKLLMFQSTLPTRGSDAKQLYRSSVTAGFNPRSPRGGATIAYVCSIAISNVSIHAPHEGERPLSKVG